MLQLPYDFTVNEDTLTGTQLFNISVTDKDTIGSNIEVECLNTSQYPDACDTFEINTITSEQNSYTGAIVLLKKLSYIDQRHYGFVLKATVSDDCCTFESLVGNLQNHFFRMEN